MNFFLPFILAFAPYVAQMFPGPGGNVTYGVTPISLLGGGNGYIACGAGVGGCTTSAINTSGASLLVALDCSYLSGYTFSDSKSNTWTALTEYNSDNATCKIRYATNPTVGSGHTFQDVGTFGAVMVLAFASADTSSPYVASSDTGLSATTCSSTPCPPGSKTISIGNVEVTFMVLPSSTLRSGILPSDTDYVIDGTVNLNSPGAPVIGATVAHLIAASTAARNPGWQTDDGSSLTVGVGAASFKHQ